MNSKERAGIICSLLNFTPISRQDADNFDAVVKEIDEAVEESSSMNPTERAEKNRPPIVCLCGSTRFMDHFFEAGWQFTLKGYIVLSVGVNKHGPPDHAGEALGQDICDKLDELHLRKIDLADEVYVLNVGGYIGSSTKKEIAYAEKIGKPVKYLEAWRKAAGKL